MNFWWKRGSCDTRKKKTREERKQTICLKEKQREKFDDREKEMRGPINGSSLQPLLSLLSLLFSFPLIHPRDHHEREMAKEESESEREMLRDNFWMYKSIRDWFLMEDWPEEQEIKEISPLLSFDVTINKEEEGEEEDEKRNIDGSPLSFLCPSFATDSLNCPFKPNK